MHVHLLTIIVSLALLSLPAISAPVVPVLSNDPLFNGVTTDPRIVAALSAPTSHELFLSTATRSRNPPALHGASVIVPEPSTPVDGGMPDSPLLGGASKAPPLLTRLKNFALRKKKPKVTPHSVEDEINLPLAANSQEGAIAAPFQITVDSDVKVARKQVAAAHAAVVKLKEQRNAKEARGAAKGKTNEVQNSKAQGKWNKKSKDVEDRYTALKSAFDEQHGPYDFVRSSLPEFTYHVA